MQKNKTYWPHAIAVAIILIVIACIFTIKVALENPVEMDTFYFDKYQNVDEDINNIILMQKEFDKKYNVTLENSILDIGSNSLKIKISNRADNSAIKEAKVDILVTRPETSKLDKKLQPTFKDGYYLVENVEIQKKGRWFIQSKIQVDNLVGFFKNELNTTGVLKN